MENLDWRAQRELDLLEVAQIAFLKGDVCMGPICLQGQDRANVLDDEVLS